MLSTHHFTACVASSALPSIHTPRPTRLPQSQPQSEGIPGDGPGLEQECAGRERRNGDTVHQSGGLRARVLTGNASFNPSVLLIRNLISTPFVVKEWFSSLSHDIITLQAADACTRNAELGIWGECFIYEANV